MSRLDELPPDQRAALSLLLRQRKSYAEVAAMLGISAAAVHDRAHAALAVLAPAQARGLTPEQRGEIGDYLLGQQPGVAERIKARAFLSGSEAARVWAQATSAELAELAAGGLPEIPPASASPLAPAPPETVEELSVAQADADGGTVHARPSSRLGGALVLAAIVAAVVVVVILISSGSGGKSSPPSANAGSTTKASTGPTPNAHFVLHSPNRKSRTVGAVEILSEAGKHAFYIEAQHVPASKGFFYALWLYNSHTSSEPLSKSPPVGKSHRLAGGALLPTNAGDFREMLLTRETNTHPTHPGHVVLRGPFALAN